MALSNTDRTNIEQQITDLNTLITEQELTGEGIGVTLAKLKIDEAFNKKQWNQFHLYILNYELEMEGLIGEYIDTSISENDVILLADSSGRLYQNPDGTDAKKIPQFVGAPTKNDRLRELTNKAEIYARRDMLRYGTGNSGSSTQIAESGYVAGASSINLEGTVNSGWVLVGGNTLLKVSPGASGGSCDGASGSTPSECSTNGGTWVTYNGYNISDRVNDQSYSWNTVVDPGWGGFSNSERATKTSSSQGLLNSLMGELRAELIVWQNILQKVSLFAAQRNRDPNMDMNDLDQNVGDDLYLVQYLLDLPLQDGDPGLDGLTTFIEAREVFRVERAERCRTAKAEYYGQRVSFTNLRGDVQSGTLKRIAFLTEIGVSGGFVSGGTKQQQDTLKALKKLLEEG